MEKIHYETLQEYAFILGYLNAKPIFHIHYVESKEFVFYIDDLQDHENFNSLVAGLEFYAEILKKK